MVACEDHTRYPSDRYPTSGLQCLGGLVDKQCTELLSVEQPTAAAYECTGDDSGFVEELGIDTELQFGGTFLQAFQFLVVFIIPALPMSTFTPRSTSFSEIQSTAILLCAHTST